MSRERKIIQQLPRRCRQRIRLEHPNRRHRNRRQNPNNRNHHQKLDQCETSFPCRRRRKETHTFFPFRTCFELRISSFGFHAPHFQLTTLSLFAPLSALPALGSVPLLRSIILSGPADHTITGAFTS